MTSPLRLRPSGIMPKLANYVATSVKRLAGDPKLFLMRKVARFEIVRDLVALSFKPAKKYTATEEHPSVFSDLDVDAIADAIRTEGVFLGINLPDAVLQDILQFASINPCYINRNSNRPLRYNYLAEGFQPVADDIRVGSYLSTGKLCESIRNLETDPTLLAIAARYLGSEPILMGHELSWNFPVPATLAEQLEAAQVFHYDLDDYRTIKFFFYILDVDQGTGPHEYIRGSHRNKPLMHQLIGVRCASIDDRKLVDCYGSDRVMTICGKAGFGFAEEVIGFHRGTLPTTTPRLLLQLEYTVNSYGNIHEKWGY